MFLHDERGQRIYEVPATGARIGREPDCELCLPDQESLVSAYHARVFPRDDGSWWIEDLGSTNGTWIKGKRITEPARLRTGDRFTLGQRGPGIAVNVPGESKRTQEERPIDVSRPLLRLRRVKGGEDLVANGTEIVLGRAQDSTVPLRTVVDTVVSKHHAVVNIEPDGSASIKDLSSRNGTFVNGNQVSEARIKVGDRIMLGWQGPLFEIRILGAAQMDETQGAAYQPKLEPAKTFGGMVGSAREKSRGSHGIRTGHFMASLGRQMVTDSSAVFRVTVLGALVALVFSVAYVWHVVQARAERAEARLRVAEQAFTTQMKGAQAEITRLTHDLHAARRNAVSRSVIDSLERRLQDAEANAARAGALAGDFERVAADNGSAVGLVIAHYGPDTVMGSGFVITRSGYLVTNRHVVADSGRPPSRDIQVIMADTRAPLVADLVALSTAPEQDLAILRLRDFHGDPVKAIDWTGRDVHQGTPVVLIGFPGGATLGLDARGVVRTSLFQGTISKAPGQWLQFSGTSLRGSSGSPIFNASGEVIAVHFGGYVDGPGVGFSVPVSRVRRWLPADAKSELGI